MDAFDSAWQALCEEGKCDTHGGMEYTRVRREWELYGETRCALFFILLRANDYILPDQEPNGRKPGAK